MTSSTLALILTSVTLSACAQVMFKLGVLPIPGQSTPSNSVLSSTALAMLFRPGVLGGLALYGIGTVLWLAVLARTELSQAYPFVGLGFVLTAALGHLVFNETLSPVRLCGTAMIIAGIFLVSQT